MILAHDTKQNERFREMGRDLFFFCKDMELLKEYISKYTAIDKVANWERMSMSTAQGAATLDGAYIGSVFDGRYIYYTPSNSFTFLRFDTTQSFTNSSAWEKMSISTAQGSSSEIGSLLYRGASFDGRYVYYCPFSSDTFLRFDTTQSFTNSSVWEKISMSTVQGVSNLSPYSGNCFDGRYIYYSVETGNTVLRFDTTQSFTNSSAWEKMSISTILGTSVSGNKARNPVFDGRYVYFSPSDNTVFMFRYDTIKVFTNSSAWEKISLSTIQGHSAVVTGGLSFFPPHIYTYPIASPYFVRFDINKTFVSSVSWEKILISTVMGMSTIDGYFFAPYLIDGRYVYFSPLNSDTFVRFDTTQSFTNSSAWEKISMSTAQGAAVLDTAYTGVEFDGKYIYFVPFNADTFLRVLACPNKFLRNQR